MKNSKDFYSSERISSKKQFLKILSNNGKRGHEKF